MKRLLLSVSLILFLNGPAWAQSGGGAVLPATATPSGYSLADMAEAMAYFSTSGNDPGLYPATPFQILYISATNTFTVNTGTRFFVPVFFVDDSPPVLGDFPDGADDIAGYVFGSSELGASCQIVVDGKATTLDSAYAAGAHAPGLLDGGGSNFIQVGAFLTPLAKGTHTVTIQATFDGDVILELTGGEPLTLEATYTVIVTD